ncbi:6-pyruvoyl-tetrahydropterin synthase [Alteromonadaceae bacterium Bs31]|nr:6-pyruvoyl-tetrahydropterin synthase [Alteromonadaceae bacterium Bs31]
MKLFVDNLCNVDFSYLDHERGIVGETWLASVELDGNLDDQGMVCDFGIVKKQLREWLDKHLDHCLLIPEHAPQLQLQTENGQYGINWHLADGNILKCGAPEQAITLIQNEQVNKQTVASWCIEKLQQHFPESVHSLTLSFTPENIPGPFYHYSHGLKKHSGNCQRIAHGHRSKIEIWRNGILSTEDMALWAQQWKDIYIASREDICTYSESAFDPDNYAFSYESRQGSFSLSIPKQRCYLIETDSTVEFIAQHIAQQMKKTYPSEAIRVKAYEGLGKGAIAEL